MDKISWQINTFKELSNHQLYELLKLRVDVFVVEQACYYADLDNLDRHDKTRHLCGYNQANELIAYARILDKGVSYPEHISIGRVVITPSARGIGLAHKMLQTSLDICRQHFPKQSIKISAQLHLKEFYQQHGFNQTSEPYLEDGIAHIAMIKEYKDKAG